MGPIIEQTHAVLKQDLLDLERRSTVKIGGLYVAALVVLVIVVKVL